MLQNSTISLIARREILYLLFYAAKAFNTRVEILKPNDGKSQLEKEWVSEIAGFGFLSIIGLPVVSLI